MPGLPPSPSAPDPRAWDALAEAGGNLFATHAWASTWWDHHGGGGSLHVLCDDAADPRVVLPLHVTGRVVRTARLVGHGPADRLGPACAPEDRELAGRLLREAWTSGGLPADVLLLQDVPVAEGWWGTVGGRRVRSEPSPVLALEPGTDWEGFLAGRSRNFRSQALRKPRSLARDHRVEERVADEATLEEDLAALLDLHARRWGPGSAFLEERQRAFVADFAAVALGRGWLRLRVLRVDGRPAAAYLGFRFGGADYFYQLGRDPALDRESVGFVVLVSAVRDAVEAGSAEFRLLRGDESYKDRFATGSDDVCSVAAGRGPRGRPVVAAVAAARARRG